MQTTLVNEDKHYQFGDDEPYPLDKSVCPTVPEVYHWARREYGRCTGRVYSDSIVDGKGRNRPVGWVFVKRAKYDDCDEAFLQVAWVTVVEQVTCPCCNRPQFVAYPIA
jgi:hypothetical protein